MNESYGLNEPSGLVAALERTYIRLLGVPEIGFRLRAMEFMRTIRLLPSNPRRMLDAGSGIGAYAAWLAERYPSATVVGCDLDQAKTAFCDHLRGELHLNNLEFLCRDITRLDNLGEPFDLITCIDVLEHVIGFDAALEAFHDALRPGGYLYLHTPQANQQRLLKRFANWTHQDHVREGFEVQTLNGALQSSGFTVVSTNETFGFLGKLAWELNHLTLSSSFALAGAVFPLLLLIGYLDRCSGGCRGLGLSILAQRPNVHE